MGLKAVVQRSLTSLCVAAAPPFNQQYDASDVEIEPEVGSR
jgi:hypothetical protein